MSDRQSSGHASSRRKFMIASTAIGASALAGCTGGNGNGNGDSNGNGDGGEGGSGGSGSSGGTEDMFGDFDPDNPHESLPQPTDVLFEHGFDVGSAQALADFPDRDEPVYGNPVREVGPDEEYLDPDTIQFAFGQGEAAASIYQDAMDPLVENVEAETGRDVEFTVLDSAAATVEAMRSDRLHVSTFNAGGVPYGVNISGAVPFGMLVKDGTFGYRLWVCAQREDDDIRSLDDLEGKTVAHAHETSNSGHLAPMALLPEEGITPGEDYEFEFSGGHDNSARGVNVGDFDAGMIASSSYGDLVVGGGFDASQLRCVWMSPPFASQPSCYHYRLHPDIVEGVRAAHLEYDYSGTSIETETDQNEFVEFDYATHHHPVLLIHQANDIEYEIGDL